MVSHEARSKDKYSIYFSGLQWSHVFHELLRIINESSSDILTAVIFCLFHSLSQSAQQQTLLTVRLFEFHSYSHISFVLIESEVFEVAKSIDLRVQAQLLSV